MEPDMILKAALNTSGPTRYAEIELDFVSQGWSLKSGKEQWRDVVTADHGPFEQKPWGVMWLLDNASAVTRTPLILWSAPTSEGDTVHVSGDGRVYQPAFAGVRDSIVKWQFLRHSMSAAQPAGDDTPVRRRVVQLCQEAFPQTSGYIYFTSQHSGPGTNCGAFPGLIMGRYPVVPAYKRGAFKVKTKTDLLYLTSPTTQWKELAEAVDAQMNPPKKVWVPFNGSNRPKPGDIYSLLQHEDRSKFQHVGIFVKEEGDTWITADGGTGENGYQGGWNHRKFKSSGEIQGEKGNLAWVAGWVDLDNLHAVAREAFPK